MEQMTQELNIENYNLNSIKKLYNSSTNSNTFLNVYTMIDIEEGKKKTFNHLMKKYNYQNIEYIKDFVDSTSSILASELFKFNNVECNVTKGHVGPTIIPTSESLNFETHRLTTIDSEFRNDLYKNNNYDPLSASNLLVDLNDTLDNVVSIELAYLCIPFTFYNINSQEGNNFFYIVENDNTHLIDISSGNYTTATLISNINNKIGEIDDISNMSLSLDEISNKIIITNDDATNDREIVFYDSSNTELFLNNNCSSIDVQSKTNNNLGWILGFRNVAIENNEYTFSYTIGSNSTQMSECICFIPYTKHFIITIDDMNKSQSNKSLVQINNTASQISRTNYYKNSPTDNELKCLNACNDISNSNTSLTKNQIYSVVQKNKYRTSYNDTNNLSANLINNIFAVIPFETKSLSWGSSNFTSDKNKFQRKYNSPVDISKLSIKLLDDKGNLINLNGAEWSLTLISTQSYKK
uniref:Uncharacterized protein n=1 Tax=Florenciella sp. virus SA2 TaxID=3240092 RepID=A0AB39J6D7_9VIRU